jgi:hypothetical protein
MKSISIFNLKQSLHVKLSKSSLAELRVQLFRKNLSIQQFLAFVVELTTNGDERMLKILDEVAYYKEQGELDRLNLKDADAIYDFLEEQSPFQVSLNQTKGNDKK